MSIYSFTYFNSRQNTFSIQARSGLAKGIVVATVPAVEVNDVTFKVSIAGRNRVLREGVKNVHAGLMGFAKALPNGSKGIKLEGLTRIRYNPYNSEHFVAEDGSPVLSCKKAILIDKKIWAEGVTFLTRT